MSVNALPPGTHFLYSGPSVNCDAPTVASTFVGNFDPSVMHTLAELVVEIAHEILANRRAQVTGFGSPGLTQMYSMELTVTILDEMKSSVDKSAAYTRVEEIRATLLDEMKEDEMLEILKWGVAYHVRDHVFGVNAR